MNRALWLIVLSGQFFLLAAPLAHGQDAQRLFERMEDQIHKAKTLQLDFDLTITQTSATTSKISYICTSAS